MRTPIPPMSWAWFLAAACLPFSVAVGDPINLYRNFQGRLNISPKAYRDQSARPRSP